MFLEYDLKTGYQPSCFQARGVTLPIFHAEQEVAEVIKKYIN